MELIFVEVFVIDTGFSYNIEVLHFHLCCCIISSTQIHVLREKVVAQ